MKRKATYNLPYIYFICFVAALGGLMFGFDLGIITGVVPYIEHQFKLSGFSLGLVVAMFELGAMIGALYTSKMADKFGRKKTMLGGAFFLIVTSIGVSISSGSISLAIWRLVQGICVGAASVLSPMYIAEVSPAHLRGRLVSVNQLTIVLGILIASLSNYYLGDNDLNSINWRFMFLSALAPATLFFILLFFIPESPRWIIQHTIDDTKAIRFFLRINNGNEINSKKEIEEIKNSIYNKPSHAEVSLKKLFGKTFLPIMLIGIGIAFLQQLCGINNITPYLQKIFVMAGIKLKAGLLNAVMLQIVFLLSTLVAIGLVDRIGRKILMQIGTGLMAVSLFLLALAFHTGTSGAYVLILVMLYYSAFAFTLGPVVWVLISEMYPNEIRGRAISITSAALWLATFSVVLVSPYMLNIGAVFNFVIFGILNVFGLFFCLKFLPETKGKTLEQMEEMWQKKGYLNTYTKTHSKVN